MHVQSAFNMFLADPMADTFPQIKEFEQIMGVAF